MSIEILKVIRLEISPHHAQTRAWWSIECVGMNAVVWGDVDDGVHQLPNEILLKKLLNFLRMRLVAQSHFHFIILPHFSIQFHCSECLGVAFFHGLSITVKLLIGHQVDPESSINFSYDVLVQLVSIKQWFYCSTTYLHRIQQWPTSQRFTMAWVTLYLTLAALMSQSGMGSFFLFIIPCHAVHTFFTWSSFCFNHSSSAIWQW